MNGHVIELSEHANNAINYELLSLSSPDISYCLNQNKNRRFSLFLLIEKAKYIKENISKIANEEEVFLEDKDPHDFKKVHPPKKIVADIVNYACEAIWFEQKAQVAEDSRKCTIYQCDRDMAFELMDEKIKYLKNNINRISREGSHLEGKVLKKHKKIKI